MLLLHFSFSLNSYVVLQISVLKNWKETEVYKLNGKAANAEANLKMLKSLSRYGEFTPEISVLLVTKHNYGMFNHGHLSRQVSFAHKELLAPYVETG